MSILEVHNLVKIYKETAVPVKAVNGIDLSIEKGEFTAIVGPSGCGKTTFLNMIGGLDKPTEGDVIVDGTNLHTLNARELTDYRLYNIGFIFQAYNLIPVLTVRENVEFIMQLQGKSSAEIKNRTERVLHDVGLGDKLDVRPGQLSGGQQQRVAVARALAPEPKFILADEPTANLDSASTNGLLDMMLEMNKNSNVTFIFSTHDERVMKRARRVVHLDDGKVVNDVNNG